MASFTEQVPKQFTAASTNSFASPIDNSVMQVDTDSDVILSEINQIRDELNVLDGAVSTERLTTIILDALPAEIMYSTVKIEAIRDPDLSLE